MAGRSGVEGREITQRQRMVLDYIRSYVAERRISPTYREIQAHFGAESVNAFTYHLKVLKHKGYLDWTPHLNRTFRLTEDAPSALETTDREKALRIELERVNRELDFYKGRYAEIRAIVMGSHNEGDVR